MRLFVTKNETQVQQRMLEVANECDSIIRAFLDELKERYQFESNGVHHSDDSQIDA